MKKLLIVALLFHYLSNGAEAIDCNVEPKNKEGQLRKHLFCEYDRDNRPTTKDGPIVIRFKMIIKGFSFSDVDGKLIVSTWLAMSWMDEHLKWDQNAFGNLSSITQSSQTIWYPDLALYNSDVASATDESCKDANCVISSTGSVSCIPPCSHTAKCSPNYNRWPFDVQNCTLHIGTWVNSGEEIDYRVLKTILTEDQLSSQDMQWKLIRATYKRNPGNFTDSKQTYPSLTFSFLMERHSASHSVIIFVPALTFVLLNLISLWVDSQSNRRIILLALSLLGHLLYMQHLFWALPANGDTVPDLLIYFRDSLLLTVALIINTIIVQGMMSCNMQIPEWVDKTTTYVASNRAGQLFLSKHLVTAKFGMPLDTSDDDVNLVESQANEKDTKKMEKQLWQKFGNIIDRGLFVALCIVYFIMMLGLLPENFLDEKNPSSVEIIGY